VCLWSGLVAVVAVTVAVSSLDIRWHAGDLRPAVTRVTCGSTRRNQTPAAPSPAVPVAKLSCPPHCLQRELPAARSMKVGGTGAVRSSIGRMRSTRRQDGRRAARTGRVTAVVDELPHRLGQPGASQRSARSPWDLALDLSRLYPVRCDRMCPRCALPGLRQQVELASSSQSQVRASPSCGVGPLICCYCPPASACVVVRPVGSSLSWSLSLGQTLQGRI
jgi:hypothetical protein